jgi:hypothetical protein
MSKRAATIATMGLVTLSLLTALSLAADKKEQKPTGACTITVYGISPTCTSPMTQDSCNASAKKVGGTASWEKGKSCPK